jgi:transglutaminase-like putative cysteine protease
MGIANRASASAVFLLILGNAFAAEPADKAPRSRTFTFTYSGVVTGLPEGTKARVWLPVPPSNSDQTVKLVAQELPVRSEAGKEPLYGNRILYFEAKANKDGEIPFCVKYHVTRREVTRAAITEDEPLERFLKPDTLVPLEGKPLELIKDRTVPKDANEAARLFYDIVNQHMRYSKEGTGWGRGDANWACASGYGNCSDFHSLFISLARSQKIPAKFEIGFPLPEKHGEGEIPGYHCWAKFKVGGDNWIPVDISEANKNPKLRDYYFGHLSPDRVAFSTGRDITLVPKQDGKPLNYFVYPYVEVDGRPYADTKVKRKFSFKDEEAK